MSPRIPECPPIIKRNLCLANYPKQRLWSFSGDTHLRSLVARLAGVFGAPGVIGGKFRCAQQSLSMTSDAARPTGMAGWDSRWPSGRRSCFGRLGACRGGGGGLRCRGRLVTRKALVVCQVGVFMELWDLRNARRAIAVTAQALGTTGSVMRDGRRTAGC
jgi:hypothetical protein